MHRLLSGISPEQLIHLGRLLGDPWEGNEPDVWDGLSPRGVPALASDPVTRTSVLGLLSFHRNGYGRQEAVRLLAGSAGGTELPFLLVRQNDWVGGIGAETRRAVNDRLLPDYLPSFVRSLPLVIHLLAFRRADLSPVVRSVVGMLARPETDALLGEVIGTSSGPVRRRVVQVALDLPGDHPAVAITHGLASPDPVVRLACAKRVRQSASGDELRRLIGRLQRDRSMPVRREGFLAAGTCLPGDAVRAWEWPLLVRSFSPRWRRWPGTCMLS